MKTVSNYGPVITKCYLYARKSAAIGLPLIVALTFKGPEIDGDISPPTVQSSYTTVANCYFVHLLSFLFLFSFVFYVVATIQDETICFCVSAVLLKSFPLARLVQF